MQIQDLAKSYQTKTDEELLHLINDSEQLTAEAHSVLVGELTRRGIDLKKHFETRVAAPRTNNPPELHVAQSSYHGIADFMDDLYRTYRKHFWLFLKLIAPAVVVGYGAVFTGQGEMRKIADEAFRRGDFSFQHMELLQMWLVNTAGYLVSWIAFCVSFGAISIAVGQIADGQTPSLSDSVKGVLRSFSLILGIGALLFVAIQVARSLAGLLESGILWVLERWQLTPGRLTFWLLTWTLTSLAVLIVSRFGLAIPAVVLDGCKVGQSMFRSDELTDGKWGVLAVLLAKSLLGGYLAGMAPYWLASFMVGPALVPWWFPWSLRVASIVGVAIVEATMFIGFALMYVRSASQSEVLSESPRQQLA